MPTLELFAPTSHAQKEGIAAMTLSSDYTEVLTKTESINRKLAQFFQAAKEGVDIAAETMSPPDPEQADAQRALIEAYFAVQKRGGRLRVVTKVEEGNVVYLKELAKQVNVRHLEDLRGNFAVNDNEYLTSPAGGAIQSGQLLVCSNAPGIVAQHKQQFETLWGRAEPLDQRMREIEEGRAPPKIELIYSPARICESYLRLVNEARTELMVIFPTSNAFHRDETIGVIAALRAATGRGVNVSILSPVDPMIQAVFPQMDGQSLGEKGSMTLRRVTQAKTQNTVTLVVADRRASLVIEERDPSKLDFSEGVGVATYATRNPTVRANIRFFERVRDEVDLREREEEALLKERRSRRQAELLQDILTHDIRNYIQICKTSAELLKEDVGGQDLYLVDAILKATDGTSDLINRTKTLARIISSSEAGLNAVSLTGSLERGASVIRSAHPDKTLELSDGIDPNIRVLADDLLDEVFVNLLSNSVKYTPGSKVHVTIRIEENRETEDAGKQTGQGPSYWKITFADKGTGIPDDLKQKVFTRYLSTAKGTGLGLSIVHALVVDRYGGRVEVGDTVKGDHTKGTKMEIWLQKPS